MAIFSVSPSWLTRESQAKADSYVVLMGTVSARSFQVDCYTYWLSEMVSISKFSSRSRLGLVSIAVTSEPILLSKPIVACIKWPYRCQSTGVYSSAFDAALKNRTLTVTAGGAVIEPFNEEVAKFFFESPEDSYSQEHSAIIS